MKKIKKILIAVLILVLAVQTPAALASEGSILEEGKNSYNILLIGSDHRDDSWNGNSDVMILITILPENQRIVMTSFMRDLYAEIPGHGVHKLNYAFAVAGGDKLVETLENNYRLSIDNYAVADFESMADIIDILGGVEMEISDAEAEVLNDYLTSVGRTESHLPGGGTYLLDGGQAVAYMRIRYVGNSDYQRTQRQRDVLSKIFEGLGSLESEELAEITEKVIPQIEHNVDTLRMMKLIAALPKFVDYELEENRIPYDDLYYTQNEMLVPDFETTILRLHESLEIAE